jgi:phosphatidylglycerophosphatase A
MKLNFRRPDFPAGISIWHPASLIAHWFGAGLMPFATGTWGSLAALPFAAVISWLAGWQGLLVATVAVALIGWWASETLTRRGGADDPGYIVVDEVAGMWLTLLFAPLTWWAYAIGFVLFRIADILKPFPAGWCDRNVHGGLGVMLDDLVAAMWSALAMWLVTVLFGQMGWS